MRLMTGALVLIAALWGGYWYVGSSAVESNLTQWLANAPADGVDVDYSSLRTRGFPNRFDTTVNDIDLTLRDVGLRWQAPFIQVFALSYKPNHLIAVWPHEQRLTWQGTAYDIESADLRASLVMEPNTTLALDRSRLEVKTLVVTPDGGTPVRLSHAFIATRQTPAEPFAHDLSVTLDGLGLPPDLRATLDPAGVLSADIDGLVIDATLELSGPIGRNAGDTQLTGIRFRDATVRWGDLSLGVSGDLTADPYGYASGSLALEAANWRDVFHVLSAAGLVDPVWEGAIAPLAVADGTPDHLSTTLSFREGSIYFGPLALGIAPRLN